MIQILQGCCSAEDIRSKSIDVIVSEFGKSSDLVVNVDTFLT